MSQSSLVARLAPALLLAACLLYGCAAGVTPQQLRTDSEVTYGRQVQKSIFAKRVEFDQLAEEFLLTLNPVFLGKMAGLLEVTAKESAKARAFLDLEPPYHRGIGLARRQAAEEAVRSGDKERCEMMLIYADLQLLHGDPETARATLTTVRSAFPGEPLSDYRVKATAMLEEARQNPAPRQRRASRH